MGFGKCDHFQFKRDSARLYLSFPRKFGHKLYKKIFDNYKHAKINMLNTYTTIMKSGIMHISGIITNPSQNTGDMKTILSIPSITLPTSMCGQTLLKHE